MRRRRSATTAHRALPACEWPDLSMPWATARSNAASAVCSRCHQASDTGGCGRAVQVVSGGCGFAGEEWRFCRGGDSTRQPQRTEPCQCVSGQPWACLDAQQGHMQPLKCAEGVVEPAMGAAAGLGRWLVGAVVCRFVDISRGGGGSTRQPRRTEPCQCVSGPGHGMGHCKVKYNHLCSMQQVWWSLHWGLRQGWAAGGLWGLRFCWLVEISRGGGSTQQTQRTEEPWKCVSGQPWACHGALQGHM